MDTELDDLLDEFLETIETGVHACAMSTKNVFSTFHAEIQKDKIKYEDNGEISFEPFL